MNSPPRHCVTRAFLFILDFLLILQGLSDLIQTQGVSLAKADDQTVGSVILSPLQHIYSLVEVSTELHGNGELKKYTTYLSNLQSPHMFYFPYSTFSDW